MLTNEQICDGVRAVLRRLRNPHLDDCEAGPYVCLALKAACAKFCEADGPDHSAYWHASQQLRARGVFDEVQGFLQGEALVAYGRVNANDELTAADAVRSPVQAGSRGHEALSNFYKAVRQLRIRLCLHLLEVYK